MTVLACFALMKLFKNLHLPTYMYTVMSRCEVKDDVCFLGAQLQASRHLLPERKALGRLTCVTVAASAGNEQSCVLDLAKIHLLRMYVYRCQLSLGLDPAQLSGLKNNTHCDLALLL